MSTNGSRPEENSFILEGLTNDNPLQGLTIINGPGVAGDAATHHAALMPSRNSTSRKIPRPNTEGRTEHSSTLASNPAQTAFTAPHTLSDATARGTRAITSTRRRSLSGRFPCNNLARPWGRIIKDKLFFFMGYEGERYADGKYFRG